jgi:aryl-alcohol dehydrogenase-like predicted oxidoreductase
MKYRQLGRTGLSVSVLSLGTGTRFGDGKNLTRSERECLVRGALDLGINYIDTAAIYGEAESFLGDALAHVSRERYVLATKFFPVDPVGLPVTPAALRTSVENSLRALRVESVDFLQIHGVRAHWLHPVLEVLGAELDCLKAEGKYRNLVVSETIVEDPLHEMLPVATATGRFAQALVGYSLLSPWAEPVALPACQQHGLGVVAMVAVPRALRDPDFLAQLIRGAQARGEDGIGDLREDKPLDWLLDAHSPTLPAAGYRYAISHPAVATVLAGTLSLDHLTANAAAVCAPPMPEAQLARVRSIFLRNDPRHWILRHI